ncbi:MAG TPA: hypothetical protein VFW87_10540 [Pirellulales bacterium]|nr:hypothetical protein [Pirellulales bacterium]
MTPITSHPADTASAAEPLSQPAATAAAGSAACRHLLSKGMFVSGMVDPAEVGMSDGHCWCNMTQHALGPDDGLVARQKCMLGRRCYEPR